MDDILKQVNANQETKQIKLTDKVGKGGSAVTTTGTRSRSASRTSDRELGPSNRHKTDFNKHKSSKAMS